MPLQPGQATIWLFEFCRVFSLCLTPIRERARKCAHLKLKSKLVRDATLKIFASHGARCASGYVQFCLRYD